MYGGDWASRDILSQVDVLIPSFIVDAKMEKVQSNILVY